MCSTLCDAIQHNICKVLSAVSMEVQCSVWGADVGTSLPKLSTYCSSPRYCVGNVTWDTCAAGSIRTLSYALARACCLCYKFYTAFMHLQELVFKNLFYYQYLLVKCDKAYNISDTRPNIFASSWLSISAVTYTNVIWTLILLNDSFKNIHKWSPVLVWNVSVRKEGGNWKDKYNHSWTLVCQHTYPSQEVASTGLLYKYTSV